LYPFCIFIGLAKCFKFEYLFWKIYQLKNNEPGGKMVWYPREMKRTNVSGVYPSSAGGGLGQDYREEE
jgi:hypothetical protein